MHLTGAETYLIVQGVVAVLFGVAAWLRSEAAHKAASRADGKATRALKRTAAAPVEGAAADNLGPEG